MSKILCLFILIVSIAFADDATDRDAIKKAITDAAPQLKTASLSVKISHEPWGEATIQLPPVFTTGITVGPIQFVTGDVALADVVADNTVYLFVMKKDAGKWTIASRRILGAIPALPNILQ